MRPRRATWVFVLRVEPYRPGTIVGDLSCGHRRMFKASRPPGIHRVICRQCSRGRAVFRVAGDPASGRL